MPDSPEVVQTEKEVMEDIAPALQEKVWDYVEELLDEKALISGKEHDVDNIQEGAYQEGAYDDFEGRRGLFGVVADIV
jgi:hypothetical protein